MNYLLKCRCLWVMSATVECALVILQQKGECTDGSTMEGKSIAHLGQALHLNEFISPSALDSANISLGFFSFSLHSLAFLSLLSL